MTELLVDENQEQEKDIDGGGSDPEITKNEDGSFVVNGKKYNSVDDLINKAVHADRHIDTIISEKRQMEQRMKELQSGSSEVKSLSEKIDALLQEQNRSKFFDLDNEGDDYVTNPSENRQTTNQQQPQKEELSQFVRDAIKDAVKPFQDKISQMESESKKNRIVGQLKDVYGSEDSVREAVREFQKKSGLSKETLEGMMQHEPEGFINLVKDSVPKPKSKGEPQATDLLYDGSPPSGRNNPEDSRQVKRGYKELVKKLRGNSSQWTLEDQAAMNEGFDKLGTRFFET